MINLTDRGRKKNEHGVAIFTLFAGENKALYGIYTYIYMLTIYHMQMEKLRCDAPQL